MININFNNMALQVEKSNKTEEEIIKEDMDEIDRQLGTALISLTI